MNSPARKVFWRPRQARAGWTIAAAWLFAAAWTGGAAGEARARPGIGPGGGIGSDAPALERKVRLRIWGGDLGEAIREFSRQADVAVIVSRTLLPPDRYPTRPLYLAIGEAPVATAMEMVARAVGGVWRFEENRIRLSAGYEWMDEPGVLRTYPVGQLLIPGETAAALDERLRELARVVSLLDASGGRRWEFALRHVPTGRDGEIDCRLDTYLPETLQDYVYRALFALDAPGAPVAPRADPSGARAAAPDSDDFFVSIRLRGESALKAVDEVALQTGWLIGFDAGPFSARPPPPVDLELGHVSRRTCVAEFSRALGLGGGAERWVDNIVWLSPAARSWERTRPSRRLLWEGLPTRGYAAADAARKAGGWPALRARILERATPWIWDDPMTALAHNPIHGTLVVRAPEETLRAVEKELSRSDPPPPGSPPSPSPFSG